MTRNARREETCLEPDGPHGTYIAFVLGLEQLDHVDGHGGVATVVDMDAAHGALVLHGKVELIPVPVGDLGVEVGEAGLLGMVVAGAEDIVLVFLEQPEPRTVGRLGSFLVCARVLEGGHGE